MFIGRCPKLCNAEQFDICLSSIAAMKINGFFSELETFYIDGFLHLVVRKIYHNKKDTYVVRLILP